MKLNDFKTLVFIALSNLIFTSCAQFVKTAERNEPQPGQLQIATTTAIDAQSIGMNQVEFDKFAFELGYNPKGGMSSTEVEFVKDRAKLRKMERAIESEKEQNHYAKILPLLQTDKEKIDYLTLPTIESRLAWANRNKIWNRAKLDPKFVDISDKQDIAVGMTAQLVKRAWGEPESVETSGNPIYKNERWKYVKDIPTSNGYKRERRFVFFESGRVIGWETE